MLLGTNVWPAGQAKKVKVVESPDDCEALAAMENGAWPVVCLSEEPVPAIDQVRATIEWLSAYQEVIFAFTDHALAKECALLLPRGKGRVAHLDQTVVTTKTLGQYEKLQKQIFKAVPVHPTDILSWDQAKERMKDKGAIKSYPLPFPSGLAQMTRGIRKGEIFLLGARTGKGKSTWARELAYSFCEENLKVGYIALEEDVEDCSIHFASLAMNSRLYLEDDYELDEEALRVFRDRLYFCNHAGGLKPDALFRKIHQLATGDGCDFIFLDHITLCVGTDGSDDNRSMDDLCRGLRGAVQDTGCGLVVVSQLRKRGDDGAFQGWDFIDENQFKGSGSLPQIANTIVAQERSTTEGEEHHTRFRLIKCRLTGETGIAGFAEFSQETGRMKESGAIFG